MGLRVLKKDADARIHLQYLKITETIKNVSKKSFSKFHPSYNDVSLDYYCNSLKNLYSHALRLQLRHVSQIWGSHYLKLGCFLLLIILQSSLLDRSSYNNRIWLQTRWRTAAKKITTTQLRSRRKKFLVHFIYQWGFTGMTIKKWNLKIEKIFSMKDCFQIKLFWILYQKGHTRTLSKNLNVTKIVPPKDCFYIKLFWIFHQKEHTGTIEKTNSKCYKIISLRKIVSTWNFFWMITNFHFDNEDCQFQGMLSIFIQEYRFSSKADSATLCIFQDTNHD